MAPAVGLAGAEETEARLPGADGVREVLGASPPALATVGHPLVEAHARVRQVEHPEAPLVGGPPVVDEREQRSLDLAPLATTGEGAQGLAQGLGRDAGRREAMHQVAVVVESGGPRRSRQRDGGEPCGERQAQGSSSRAVPTAGRASFSLRRAAGRALSGTLLLLGVACTAPPVAPPPPDLAPWIRAALARPAGQAGAIWSEPEALARFYAARAWRPVWLAPDGRPGTSLAPLRRAVGLAERHGLRAESYRAPLLARVPDELAGAGMARRASLELLLSDAFLHLAHDLSQGAVDPRSLHPGFERADAAPPDPAAVLAAALATGDLIDALERLAPPHSEYAALAQELARERARMLAGDPGARDRIARLRANLERWRWLPRDLGARYLRVDTPAFRLRAFELGEAVLTLRVVVGDVGWETPLAEGLVTQLVLNPSWVVPRSIATREMLPAIRADVDYLARHHYQVLVNAHGTLREVDPSRIDWNAISSADFPFWLRQPPGGDNPLGAIKFLFANPYDVYLHGTPAASAFQRPLRALSHGCVRVENERALARFALAPDPAWSPARLEQSLREGSDLRVPLPQPLPVYLLYFTVEADARGHVIHLDDPYGWDAALIEALQIAAVPGEPPEAESPSASRDGTVPP